MAHIPTAGIELPESGPPVLENWTNDKQISINNSEVNHTGYNFGTVRGTVKVYAGRWYFEVKLKTGGSARIGWCTDKFYPESRYSGLGADDCSWGFDGSRKTKIHNEKDGDGSHSYGEYWNSGDVVGCILDLGTRKISYTLNGKDLGVAFSGVRPGDASGLMPAVSVYRNTKVSVNFGRKFANPAPHACPLNGTLTKAQKNSLDKVFNKYFEIGIKLAESGDTGDVIKDQGVLELGKDLGAVDDSDPLLLILAWKLRAQEQWEFSADEFIIGFGLHGATTFGAIKKIVQKWKKDIESDAAQFRSFHNFIFEYLKPDNGTALGKEEALMAWSMIGMPGRWTLWPKWEAYLNQCERKAVTRDTWQMLLTFIEQLGADYKNYDPMDCWPTAMDEFYEYLQENE